MPRWKYFMAAAAVACAGCTGATRRTPALEMPAASSPGSDQTAPPKRDLLQEAGDTTWRVVTAPARVVAPLIPSKPAAAEKKQPETFDPPAVHLVPRGNDEP